jgi:CubicO group peptidase (beta-lactamase class C family)
MTERIVSLALVSLVLALSAAAQPAPTTTGVAEMTADDVQQVLPPFVRAQLGRRRIAGAVVVLVKDDAVLLDEGFGFADVAAHRPMDQLTPVRIGSVTKLMTALAVMQLVDEKRISLDADVNRYLDFTVPSPGGRAPVTLRRLLSHQTAFADRIGGIGTSAPATDLGSFLATRVQPRLQQRDDVVAYANYNAALAARIVERVSGQRFDRYLDARIFKPLGMTRTTAVQPAPAALQVSAGYVRADAPPTRVSMAADTILEAGSTGVVAPGADMAQLLRAFLHPAPSLLSRRALSEMMTEQAHVPLGFMGLGMYSPLGVGGNPFVGHDGGTGAFQSVVALLPDERFGLFASYNSDGLPNALTAPAELLQFVAARYFPGARMPGRSPDAVAGTYAPTRRVDSSMFRLRQLAQQVTVTSTNGVLSIRPAILPFGQPMTKVAPGVFTWSRRDVAFTGSGNDAMMQIGAPPNLFRRVPWWENAGLVVPAVIVSLLVSWVALLGWAIRMRRGRHREPSSQQPYLIRVALLLQLAAWTITLWLVFAGWPHVALSASFVLPLTTVIYATAWAAVLLTPIACWQLVVRLRAGASTGVAARESFLVAMLVILSLYSVYWRVAGTTLAL